MYPPNTAAALIYLGYSADQDFSCFASSPGGAVTVEWSHVDTQPTEQAIIDTLASSEFATWLAENGGDPVLTLRRRAREALDAQTDTNQLIRAALIETLLYVRDAHRNLNALIDGIGVASNLAQVKTAAAAIGKVPAPADDAAFLAGARAAIKDRIDAGEADN